MMKSKKVKIAAYLTCMAILAAWMRFSNGIIGKIVNKEMVKEVEFESVKDQYQKDFIYYAAVNEFDYIRYTGGWLDKLSFSGWAYCKTEEENQDRKVSFLLRSDDVCYELMQSIISRTDVSIDVPTGYTGQFSLLDVKSGIYDIYLCCWENETNHGLADILYQLVRDGNHAEVIPWSTSPLEKAKAATLTTQSHGYLDSVRLQDGMITIRGWEFVKDQDSADQSVYVEITDAKGNSAQYPTKSLTRTDVSNGYNDQRYAQSGYVTIFPEDELKDDFYLVRVFVENGGDVWQSRQYSINRQGDTFRVFQSPVRLASALENPLTATQKEQSLGYIDSVNLKGGLATFTGWEFAPDRESLESSIIIELTDSDGKKTQYPTMSLPRKDVANGYNDQRYLQSGYTMSIPDDDLSNGNYTVRVFTENGGEVWKSKQYSMYKSGEQIRVFQSPIWIASALECPLTATKEEQSLGYLDSVKISGDLITFVGWEFAPDRESAESSIAIEITDADGKKTQYSVMSLPRTGVAEDYKDQKYLQSGYTMSILEENLPDGTYTVRAFTENGGAVWRSKQYTVIRSGEEIAVQQY